MRFCLFFCRVPNPPPTNTAHAVTFFLSGSQPLPTNVQQAESSHTFVFFNEPVYAAKSPSFTFREARSERKKSPESEDEAAFRRERGQQRSSNRWSEETAGQAAARRERECTVLSTSPKRWQSRQQPRYQQQTAESRRKETTVRSDARRAREQEWTTEAKQVSVFFLLKLVISAAVVEAISPDMDQSWSLL